MSLQDKVGKNSLSLKTLGLLHRYLDDFVLVGKARRGELSPVELETFLRKAAHGCGRNSGRFCLDYKRFRNR